MLMTKINCFWCDESVLSLISPWHHCWSFFAIEYSQQVTSSIKTCTKPVFAVWSSAVVLISTPCLPNNRVVCLRCWDGTWSISRKYDEILSMIFFLKVFVSSIEYISTPSIHSKNLDFWMSLFSIICAVIFTNTFG